MKNFAFPISVKCANMNERIACLDLLLSIGYEKYPVYDDMFIVTNYFGRDRYVSDVDRGNIYSQGRHYIDHFNADLVRDIAAACTNDTWQEGEPWITPAKSFVSAKNNAIDGYAGEEICFDNLSRPTIEQICEYHGYQVVDKNIVHKSQIVNDSDCSCGYIVKCVTNALTWSGKDHTMIVGRPNKGESMIKNLMCKQMEDDAIEALKRVQEIEGCKYTVTKTETTETKLL